ncbi:MAG: Nicotinamide-nucleotide amidase [uncultured Sphingomonadaceae bacterium]|uniref:Nicotinamide-nucleotide amidase n=1 Tax=uncultured Sphingomonadaceae bacterium TaxID=169976 RepID=A0A6J4U1E0_9SPHN|nr:MAG: Nicotinamide-nucleotide amidase [uncultured Sphingomonadaceae bacterium]
MSEANGLPARLIEKAREVVDANRAAGRRILVVESCTGGLVGAAITEVPGSSDVFEGGFITYADEAKTGFVGVSGDVIETFGAVSIAAAWAMAQGGLERSRADVAVAITGVAGPGGGSAHKPVGTVVFARAERGNDPRRVVADKKDFGDLVRAEIRFQAALCALELLMPDAPAP